MNWRQVLAWLVDADLPKVGEVWEITRDVSTLAEMSLELSDFPEATATIVQVIPKEDEIRAKGTPNGIAWSFPIEGWEDFFLRRIR